MRMWVAEVEGLAPTELFRCGCSDSSAEPVCAYHRADWPLLLSVVLEEFTSRFGAGPVELDAATVAVLPAVRRRLSDHPSELAFAESLFYDSMLATANQWTNGQHRTQAAMDAGCTRMLFAD